MIRSAPYAADRLDREPRVGPDLLLLQAVQQRDDRAGVLAVGLVLDAGVQVFGVLADDDHVHLVEPGPHAGVGLARPQARIQAQLVPQRHVHRTEPGADRGRDRALQGDPVGLDRLQGGRRQRRAGGLHHVDASLLDIPVEGRPDGAGGGLEHPTGRLGQLGPGTVARHQGYAVSGHTASLSLPLRPSCHRVTASPARHHRPGRRPVTVACGRCGAGAYWPGSRGSARPSRMMATPLPA